MSGARAGSALSMEHQFTLPARVVEVTGEGPPESDPETGELLPPAPVATDDGTPISPDEQRGGESVSGR
jgi:hypothetical protein